MKRITIFAIAAALGNAGPVFADGTKQSSGWQAPGQLQGSGHGQFTTHCGPGGWDTPGGGIPTGCSTGPAVTSSNTPIGIDLPEARAGQCFARVIIPAIYKDVPKTVTVQDAHEKLSVTEPEFAPDTVSVKVRDEGIKYIVRQARYETQTEQVLVKPAYERLTVTPATFETISEHVQVGEPRLVWRPGKNLSGVSRTDPHTGAVYCLVEEPGKTITVQRRVVRIPEQIRSIPVPAQYISVSKQVLVDPGGVEQQVIPAEFRQVPVERLVNPAQQIAGSVAAQTKTINTRVLVAPERFEWVPVLCDTNADHAAIVRIQTALAQSGHYQGRIDGIAGPQTEAAIRSFQQERGLPVTGQITADTADALGVGDLVSGARQSSQTTGQVTTASHQPAWTDPTRRHIPDRWSNTPTPQQPVQTAAIPNPARGGDSVSEQPRRLDWTNKAG